MTNSAASARICPNCERERPESFCPACGQSDRDYVRSFRPVLSDLLRETFELDSRIFRTLKLLLFKPGTLTREFSRNRRAGFVSPIRLYIVSSFLFFLLLSLLGNFDEVVVTGVSEADVEVQGVEPPPEENLAALRAALPQDRRSKFDDVLARPANDAGRQLMLVVASGGDFEERHWIERIMLPGVIDIVHDPSVIPRRFIANMPIAMFCVLPFLGLVLAVLYLRKKRYYVEHLVFAIHLQTFTFLIYAAALLLPESGPGAVARVVCLLIPYPYFVIALKRYYENGWLLSVAKSLGAYMLYSMVLFPAFLISVFVTG